MSIRLISVSAKFLSGINLNMPRNMRIRNRAVILILLPATIFLWLIGWTLFWTGTKNQHRKPKPTQQANMTITTGILLDNHEEIST